MTDHEHHFASTVGTSDAVAFRYARTALAVALRGLGLEPGHRVALSPLTCKVVLLAIRAVDLEPLYVDVNRRTLNLDPADRRLGLEPVRAIVAQHTYGNSGGVAEVMATARSRRLPVVEDCAQVLPGHRGARASRGIAEVYSNNLGKPMPAGSGGMLVTSDASLATTARECRSAMRQATLLERSRQWAHRLGHRFVTPRTYWVLYEAYRAVAPGYRGRPISDQIASEVDAVAGPPTARQEALGSAALRRIPELAAHRLACTRGYRDRLRGSPAVRVPEDLDDGPLYYFPVFTECKADVLALARRKGVEIVPWPRSTPIYPLDRWEDLGTLGYQRGMCPQAEWVACRLVGLPTHLRVGPRDMDRAVAVLSMCHS